VVGQPVRVDQPIGRVVRRCGDGREKTVPLLFPHRGYPPVGVTLLAQSHFGLQRPLPVMSSLARREVLAGKAQMIYIDPPYGIKFGSNFQSEIG
jgi:hypothetical protein